MQINIKLIIFLSTVILSFLKIIVFCSSFICIGILLIKSYYKLKKECTKDIDAVVAYVSEDVEYSLILHRRNISYYTFFQYTYGGIEYKVQSNAVLKNPKYKEGQTVTIKINPDKPDMLIVPESRKRKYIGIIFSLTGLAFLSNTIFKTVKLIILK